MSSFADSSFSDSFSEMLLSAFFCCESAWAALFRRVSFVVAMASKVYGTILMVARAAKAYISPLA